jgi:hypothetical protein
MEPNEIKEVDEIEPVEEIEETKDEFDNDTTDWKALALKNQGIAKRYQTKLQKKQEADKLAAKEAEEAKTKEKQPQDKKDFDYAEKSYLLSNGIKKDEITFVWEEHQKTGKSIDEILESKYFQNELRDKRELAETEEAVPRGTKRTAGSTRDTVEYWQAKGELPPRSQPELRRAVLNARIKKEEAASKFTDTPVV